MTGIACPTCGVVVSRVTDSRGVREGRYIRRRRLCARGHRFTTVEAAVGRHGAKIATAALSDKTAAAAHIRYLAEELAEAAKGLT